VQPGAHTLKPHSINTRSFGEALHVMQMLKHTAQIASFSRAQHWKVAMEWEAKTGHTRAMTIIQYLSPLPRFRFPGTGLQLTTGLTSSIGDGAACKSPNRQRGQSL